MSRPAGKVVLVSDPGEPRPLSPLDGETAPPPAPNSPHAAGHPPSCGSPFYTRLPVWAIIAPPLRINLQWPPAVQTSLHDSRVSLYLDYDPPPSSTMKKCRVMWRGVRRFVITIVFSLHIQSLKGLLHSLLCLHVEAALFTQQVREPQHELAYPAYTHMQTRICAHACTYTCVYTSHATTLISKEKLNDFTVSLRPAFYCAQRLSQD